MSRPKVEEQLESMNFRLDKSILERVEKKWRLELYRNRTTWITEAIENRLDAIVCPFCHAVNPRGGRVCSVCLRPLTADDEVTTLVKVTKVNQMTGDEEEV